MKKRLLLVLTIASSILLAETPPVPKEQKCQSGKNAEKYTAHKTPISNESAAEKVQILKDAGENIHPSCTLSKNSLIHFQVIGQGVAPANTVSSAQAMALAKRAAVADAYRQLGEKICGVRIEGRDLVRNMMVSRSTVRTHIDAIIRNARILDTKFKDGLCEVEMEVTLNGKEWYSKLSH